MKDLEEKITAGEAAIEPVTKKPDDDGHCKYCEYKGICGYDPKIPGYQHRLLEKYDKNTVCQAMSIRLAKTDKQKG